MQYSLSLDHTLISLLELLRDGSIYPRLVGGYIRDAILAKQNADIDIATSLLPSEVIARLAQVGITTIPTGLKHGTVTAISQGQTFEITTLREDLQCDGRYAQVSFSKDFAQDASRRDFTINALSYSHQEQRVYDYFGGLEHLAKRQVIFIRQPIARIQEDHLRIMRFFRFSASYANSVDEEGYVACIELSPLITKLSRERIHAELNKLLLAPQAAAVLTLMKPILSLIFKSNYRVENLAAAIQIANKFNLKLTLASLYSALFSENTDWISLRQDLSTNCFSNKLIYQVSKMLSLLKELKQSINKQLTYHTYWLEDPFYIAQYIMLGVMAKQLAIEEAQALLKAYDLKIWPGKLPVNGSELQTLGYQGKELGVCLARLKKLWIQSDFQLSKNQLLDLASRSHLS